MNGMLLAAGRGERMEPLSSFLPKPALDVLGEPLLACGYHLLRDAGCDPLVVNLHRHPAAVGAAARSCEPGYSGLCFSYESELLGGAGGVAAARRFFASGPVLLANADAEVSADLAPLLAAGSRETAVLGLLPQTDARRWSTVLLDDEGWVSEILPPGAGPTEGGFLFTGVQLLGEAVVAALPDPPAPMDALWEPLRRRRRLWGTVLSGQLSEAGTPAAYRELVVARLTDGSWIHPAAAVAPAARLEVSAVSAGCRVGGDSSLTGTVVTALSAVEAGCALTDCVVAGPLRIASGTRLSGRLVLPSGDFPL